MTVEDHSLPIAVLTLTSSHGAEDGSSGLARFVAKMLLRGSKSRAGALMAEALEDVGAWADAWATRDAVVLQVHCLSSRLASVLNILGDVIRHPTFDAAEIENERDELANGLAERRSDLSAVTEDTVGDILYPSTHPYHTPLVGTEASIRGITERDLRDFVARNLGPRELSIAIGGDVTLLDVLPRVEESLGAMNELAHTSNAPPSMPPAPSATAPKIVIVDRLGATQSHISIASPGLARSSPDYYAATVLNQVLGGAVSSRIFLNLRQKHGYTYGARSDFDMLHGPGPFHAGGAFFVEKTAPAVTELLAEIHHISAEAISDSDLKFATDTLVHSLPARFATAETASWAASELAIEGLPLDTYENWEANYRAVTTADVLRVASAILRPERLRIIVVGDAAKMAQSLRDLGIGSVFVRKAP